METSLWSKVLQEKGTEIGKAQFALGKEAALKMLMDRFKGWWRRSDGVAFQLKKAAREKYAASAASPVAGAAAAAATAAPPTSTPSTVTI